MPAAQPAPPIKSAQGTALPPPAASPAPAGKADDADDPNAGLPRSLILPAGSTETEACQAGLKSHGLKDSELWVMMHEPAGICPGNGVTEARIRQILGFWTASGCTKHTPQEMSRAIDTHTCAAQ